MSRPRSVENSQRVGWLFSTDQIEKIKTLAQNPNKVATLARFLLDLGLTLWQSENVRAFAGNTSSGVEAGNALLRLFEGDLALPPCERSEEDMLETEDLAQAATDFLKLYPGLLANLVGRLGHYNPEKIKQALARINVEEVTMGVLVNSAKKAQSEPGSKTQSTF